MMTKAFFQGCSMDEVLTIKELSAYLKIPKSRLYKLVWEGKVPGQKIGRHLRFSKAVIDRWLGDTHGDTTTRQDSRFGRPKAAPKGGEPGKASIKPARKSAKKRKTRK